ncbi:NAD(P)/FAD-dependent oxidoreductase [Streptomyces sp. NPDC058052]|uniref:NAD(P)/FAD-dependent oxidoreductase n=1 Tax=Streptomyces sp. NPDC058052 TaxID=3346316 RepID=UPI0036EE035C
MTSSTTTADVAVVGGGIIGLATAERLTAHGLTVAVIDPAGIAGGATSASGGLVRAFDPSTPRRRHAAAGLALYLRQGHRGTWPALRRQGSLSLVARTGLPEAAAAVADLEAAGHTAEILTAHDLAARFPSLDVPDDLAAVHEPDAGWLPVGQVARAMARDAGPRLRTVPARATRLLTDGSRATGVHTTAGPVRARAVLLAAGAASTGLAATAGVHLPLRTRAVGYCLFRVDDPVGLAALPTVVDRTTGAWLRPWGADGLVLAGVSSRETDVPEAVRRGVPPQEEERVRAVVRHRYPRLATAPLAGGVTAYDAMAPQGDGEVTARTGLAGLVTATGWNGGGFKLAPAIGEIAAARLQEEASR